MTDQPKPRKLEENPPITTEHSVNGLNYTVTAGYMPLRDLETDDIKAQIYYTAYQLNGVDDPAKRPLTFVFNGGPGAASIWLHLGALGPYRARMEDEGWMPAAPYQLIPNDATWLDLTDLVFIDPVGTGYSHAVDEETAKSYWNLEQDIAALSEVIRLYLARNNRWGSPLFLAGESYGTMRSAGIAGYLLDHGIAFNGLMLISMTLNFQTIRFDFGNDLPFHLYLPSFAATAHYHNQLSPELQQKPLSDLMAEVEAFSETDYLMALAKGDRLSEEVAEQVAQQVARYSGLSPDYVRRSNLRVEILRFCKELLKQQGLVVGRLDSRYTAIGAPEHIAGIAPNADPSMTAIVPPYTAMMNQYARGTLQFETDRPYIALNTNLWKTWEWGRGTYPDTSSALRKALVQNPHMQVLVGLGYYDLATPYFATEYTLSHLGIPPELRRNIHTAGYNAGHMMYLQVTSLIKLKADITEFIEIAAP